MLQALQTKIIESYHPVGVKKISHWNLPPSSFAYGLRGPTDEEGVSIITRSWKIHHPSSTSQPPQDFIKINRMAIKKSATNLATNKDFRKKIDVRRKMRYGSLEHRIALPPGDFVYGIANRPSTPIKDVINNSFGNRAEKEIRKDYDNFMKEKARLRHLVPSKSQFFDRLMENRKKLGNEEEKPLYKMKMFKNVGSKVAEGIKAFKNYYMKKENGKKIETSNLDKMIEKVQGEIQQAEEKEKEKNKEL